MTSQPTVVLDHYAEPRIRSRLQEQTGPQLHGALDIALPADLPLEGWWALTLLGRNGAGKSWLALRVLKELATTLRLPYRFQSCPELVSRLHRSVSESDGASHSILEYLITVELLVLDDIMRIRLTPYVTECLVQILHQRCEWERRTILTCDQSPKTLDPAIYSRLGPARGGLAYQVRR